MPRRLPPIAVANPHERSPRSFVLWFGACAPTYVLAYGHLDDALEAAAEWLADNAPGHLMPLGDPELDELMAEACAELGLAWPPEMPWHLEDDGYQRAREEAEADLTLTESGYLTAYEWGIALENPSRADLVTFYRDLTNRHPASYYGSR